MFTESVGIKAVGSYLPNRKKTIKSPEGRNICIHTASTDDTTYTMGEIAAKQMLEKAGLQPSDLSNQYIYGCCEAYGDYLFQMHGREIMTRAGVDNIISFNISQGPDCSLLATRLLMNHLAVHPEIKYGVIVAPEHWGYHSQERLLGDAVLGDGAAVLLLEKNHPNFCIRSIATKTIGKYNDIVYNEVGGWAVPLTEGPCKEGEFVVKVHNQQHYAEIKEIYMKNLELVMYDALKKAKVSWEMIDHFVIHSSTPLLHERFLIYFDLDEKNVYDSSMKYGYMCSAGLLLSLQSVIETHRFDKQSFVLATSLGVDGNWSAAVIEV